MIQEALRGKEESNEGKEKKKKKKTAEEEMMCAYEAERAKALAEQVEKYNVRKMYNKKNKKSISTVNISHRLQLLGQMLLPKPWKMHFYPLFFFQREHRSQSLMELHRKRKAVSLKSSNVCMYV